jgi:hypothetical protein
LRRSEKMHPARFLRPKSTFLTIPILGDSSMQENYRGIAINSCIGKLFNSQCFWMALTLQNLKLGGNLECSWYSCNILTYCSNRCIVWFYIPGNCPAHAKGRTI